MHSSCSRGLLGVVLVVLIQLAVSLPPDFFRNGRGHKRAEANSHIVTAACKLCEMYSQELAMKCLGDAGESRNFCLSAFKADVDALLSDDVGK